MTEYRSYNAQRGLPGRHRTPTRRDRMYDFLIRLFAVGLNIDERR